MKFISRFFKKLFPDSYVIWSNDCGHAQADFVNVKSTEDLFPYLRKIEARGTCCDCKKTLGKLSIVVISSWIIPGGHIDLAKDKETIKKQAAGWKLDVEV